MASNDRNENSPTKPRRFVAGLWSASVVIVVAGFLLRAFGSFFHHPQLRVTGVALIACGLIAAALGWIGEKFLRRRSGRA